jgi:hypothetical protein
MRCAITLLLMLAAAPAWAQWMKVDDAENAIHYIDPATISKVGQMRKVWVTQYPNVRGPDGELSRRSFLEYDCAGARFRILSISKQSNSQLDARYRLSQGNASQAGREVPTNIPAATVQRILCAP